MPEYTTTDYRVKYIRDNRYHVAAAQIEDELTLAGVAAVIRGMLGDVEIASIEDMSAALAEAA